MCRALAIRAHSPPPIPTTLTAATTTRQILALIGGLHGSKASYANAFGGVCYAVGSFLYASGYSSNKANGEGRYAKVRKACTGYARTDQVERTYTPTPCREACTRAAAAAMAAAAVATAAAAAAGCPSPTLMSLTTLV